MSFGRPVGKKNHPEVAFVAVFLAYQANNGLPFVPTYQLSAQLPDADSLVKGNDVRIGGQRVGQITSITPENVDNAPCPNDPTRLCTGQVAKVDMDLNKDLEARLSDMLLRSIAREPTGSAVCTYSAMSAISTSRLRWSRADVLMRRA